MFAQHIQPRSSNISSQYVLGFSFVDSFSAGSTNLSKSPVSFLTISIVKLAKIWILLENSTHVEGHWMFSFESM